MIDNVSDKLTNWLIARKLISMSYSDFDYYFRTVLFNFLVVTSLLTVNFILHTLVELLVISIIFNVLRLFVDGYHCESLENCIIVTTLSLSSTAYLSSFTHDYALMVYFVSILVGVGIMNTIKVSSDRSIYINVLGLFIILGGLCIYFGFNNISNSISYSILLVYLFLNKK